MFFIAVVCLREWHTPEVVASRNHTRGDSNQSLTFMSTSWKFQIRPKTVYFNDTWLDHVSLEEHKSNDTRSSHVSLKSMTNGQRNFSDLSFNWSHGYRMSHGSLCSGFSRSGREYINATWPQERINKWTLRAARPEDVHFWILELRPCSIYILTSSRPLWAP